MYTDSGFFPPIEVHVHLDYHPKYVPNLHEHQTIEELKYYTKKTIRKDTYMYMYAPKIGFCVDG